MQVKYVHHADLDVLESTVNMLLMNGWERDSGIMTVASGQHEGEWLICMIRHSYRVGTRIQQAMPDLQPVTPAYQPEIDLGRAAVDVENGACQGGAT